MRRVKVPVGQAVTHPGDLRPRKGRFAGEQLRREGFDRFADLDETDPHGVEDEHVVQVAALEVGVDGVDGGHDVFEALTVPAAAERCRLDEDLGGHPRLEIICGHQVDGRPEQHFKFRLAAPEGHQPHAFGYIHEQVDIALGAFLAASDAAEDPGVGQPAAGDTASVPAINAGHEETRPLEVVVTVFGPYEIAVDGQVISRRLRTLAKELLAWLCLRP